MQNGRTFLNQCNPY